MPLIADFHTETPVLRSGLVRSPIYLLDDSTDRDGSEQEEDDEESRSSRQS